MIYVIIDNLISYIASRYQKYNKGQTSDTHSSLLQMKYYVYLGENNFNH